MAILSSVVSALSTFYQDSDDIHDEEQVHLSIVRLIAKLPTIASYAYKKSIGQPFLYPNNELDLIENFLTMMFAVPSERYEVSPTVVHALKQLLILHADHEQNCSTPTAVTSPSTCARPRTRTIPSGCPASGTASTRTTTPARGCSARRPSASW